MIVENGEICRKRIYFSILIQKNIHTFAMLSPPIVGRALHYKRNIIKK